MKNTLFFCAGNLAHELGIHGVAVFAGVIGVVVAVPLLAVALVAVRMLWVEEVIEAPEPSRIVPPPPRPQPAGAE